MEQIRPEDLPHSYEVNWLGPSLEPRLLRTLLAALDLEAKVLENPLGLSGVSHPTVLVGERPSRRHMVLIQTGLNRIFDDARPRAHRYGEPPQPPNDRRSLPERDEEMRRQLLFASYDLRARFEKDGWTCDILYFLNISSPDDLGRSLSSELRARFGGTLGGIDLHSTVYGSTEPIAKVRLNCLRDNAIATGSCLVSLADFSVEQLKVIANASDSEALSAAREALTRNGVLSYFAPPVDELMLTSLSHAGLDWSEQELLLVPQTSFHYKHPVSPASLLAGVNKDDPREVALALRDQKFIQYTGESSRVTPQGATIVEKIQTMPQESWAKKVAAVVDLVKAVKGLIR